MSTASHSDEPTACLFDLASRLRYMGYYGDQLTDLIQATFNDTDLSSYENVLVASGTAGYDSGIHGFDWTGYRLPSPSVLPMLSLASITLYRSRGAIERGDPNAPRARNITY